MNAMTRRAWLLTLVVLAIQLPSAPQAPAGSFVESRGARVRVPAGWSANDRLIAAGGPIAITNFAGAYAQGGLPPPGGAEIEITSVPSPPNLVDFIRKELSGAPIDPVQEFVEGPNSGLRTSYTESVSPDASLKTVVNYIPHGPTLYKFYLTYWSGDTRESALTAALSAVVREAQLR
jgi:hypothetical protein